MSSILVQRIYGYHTGNLVLDVGFEQKANKKKEININIFKFKMQVTMNAKVELFLGRFLLFVKLNQLM